MFLQYFLLRKAARSIPLLSFLSSTSFLYCISICILCDGRIFFPQGRVLLCVALMNHYFCTCFVHLIKKNMLCSSTSVSSLCSASLCRGHSVASRGCSYSQSAAPWGEDNFWSYSKKNLEQKFLFITRWITQSVWQVFRLSWHLHHTVTLQTRSGFRRLEEPKKCPEVTLSWASVTLQ